MVESVDVDEIGIQGQIIEEIHTIMQVVVKDSLPACWSINTQHILDVWSGKLK